MTLSDCDADTKQRSHCQDLVVQRCGSNPNLQQIHNVGFSNNYGLFVIRRPASQGRLLRFRLAFVIALRTFVEQAVRTIRCHLDAIVSRRRGIRKSLQHLLGIAAEF